MDPGLDISLQDMMAALPDSAKAQLLTGVKALGDVPSDKLPYVAEVGRQGLTRSLAHSNERIARELGVSEDRAVAVTTAASFLSFFISKRKQGFAELEKELIDAQIAPEDNIRRIGPFLTIVERERSTVAAELEQDSLATRALPSLQSFELAVDLRLAFEGDSITAAVPVVVCHMDTNGEGQVLWFQMTKVQVETLVRDLQSSLNQLRLVEKRFESLCKLKP